MKKIFLFTTVLCFLLSGCAKGFIENDLEVGFADIIMNSGIVVRASKAETATKDDVEEPVVFTGNDIFMFYENTGEIRFKDNFSMKVSFTNVPLIKFYIDNEYLFSAFVYIDSSISQIFNSLVFFYNTTENKFYLLDGYPPNDSRYPNSTEADIRDENMQNIADEWEMFIEQLKKEGKYNK